MSIIYDALQKVQNNISKETAAPQAKNDAPKASPAKTKIKPYFIYILALCLGLVLSNFAYNFVSEKKNSAPVRVTPAPRLVTPPVSPVKQPPVVQPLNSQEPSNPNATGAEPALMLNGVFFEQGEGYALINNKILRLGDEIDGAKITEITIDGVSLDSNGKTIKLASPSS